MIGYLVGFWIVLFWFILSDSSLMCWVSGGRGMNFCCLLLWVYVDFRVCLVKKVIVMFVIYFYDVIIDSKFGWR